jgi:hypothetical protein
MATESDAGAKDVLVQTLTLPITAAEVRYNTGEEQKYVRLTFTGGATVDLVARR